MQTLSLLIFLINSISIHLIQFYGLSKIIFLRLHYQIRKIYIPSEERDHQRKYCRQNSLTDLHEAVLQNCEQTVRYAIASGVPIDLVDHAMQTALYYACQRGYRDLVQYFLECHARHDLIDLNQTSPLWIAAKEGHADIVLILLKKGANPDQRARDGTTGLYHSSYEGHIQCVYHLVRYRASINCAKNSGASPLFVAGRNGHYRIVKHLLKHGANPCQTQEDLRSPLHTALLYNRVKSIRLLLRERQLNRVIEQRDIYDWSHWHFVAKKGNIRCAKILFHYLRQSGKEINLNEKDVFGNTALHIAIFNQKSEFAHYLIKQKFDINEPNLFGWTYETFILKQDQDKSNRYDYSPKGYLQRVLSKHSLRYTREEDLIRNQIEDYIKELLSFIEKANPLFLNQIIRSGSYHERTRVGLPDEFDYMINLNEFERLCQFVENDLDPCGYGRLYPLKSEEASKKLNDYLDPITQCLSTEKIRKQFYQLLTSARASVIRKEISSKFPNLKLEWTSGDKRCGTAVHAEWYGIQYPYLAIKIDVVPCLTIHSWPQTATMKYPNDKCQFHIIPRSPNAEQTYLWRISMSEFESIYFNQLTSSQLDGYLSLKTLRLLIPYSCRVNGIVYTSEELITSYMFKNEFLHEIVRYPHHYQWTGGSLIHRVSTILKRLHQHLLIGSIKSFYIQNYNVIDLNDYQQLRREEIKYVRMLLSHLKEKVQGMNNKYLRRNTFTIVQPITKKHPLRERAFTTQT